MLTYPAMARAALLETAERLMQFAQSPGWDEDMRLQMRYRAEYLRTEAAKYAVPNLPEPVRVDDN